MPFPDICESSISYGSEPDIVRTVYHSSNTRQRFIRKKRDDVFNVTYEVTSTELAEFESFITTEISNGADEFTGNYYDGAEHTGTLQIINGEYNVSYIAQDYWSLSYSFEVKDRDLSDAESVYDFVNAAGGFENLSPLFNALEDLVNNNTLVA
ncbi:MAG: hypothetical protein ACN2B6_01405 [Rickettsiales bacterium]